MKDQLEALVGQMYRGGIRYSEAVRTFKRIFILTVLQDHQGNQYRAAQALGMHRNTLWRVISAFSLDVRALRLAARRRPPSSERLMPVGKKQLSLNK